MKCHLFLFAILQILVLASAENLLILGDSWASASQDFLSHVCSPLSFILGDAADTQGIKILNVQNDAKAGSDAAQWASGEVARKSFEKSDFDYVWLSLGGNDFLDTSGCDMEQKQEIAENVLSVISQIVDSSSNENIKILYFGYGIPTADICGGGTTAARMDEILHYIRDSIGSSAFSSYVTLVEITSEFVTPQSAPLSDAQWFYDSIHINEFGYFKLFSLQAVQEFFGCIDPSTSAPSTTISDAPSSVSSDAPSSAPSGSVSSSPSDAPYLPQSSASPSDSVSSSPSDAPYLPPPPSASSETAAPTFTTDTEEDDILSDVASFFQDIKDMISSSESSRTRALPSLTMLVLMGIPLVL